MPLSVLRYAVAVPVPSVIDTATNTVTATIAVGNRPNAVAVTPDGTRAYVVNANSNTISVISTATNTVTTTVPVGALPTSAAVTPDGAHVYITNGNSNTVSVISTASDTVTATVGSATFPQHVAMAKLPSSVTLTSSPNPSQAGRQVTFTATVTGTASTPTGTVTFKDGATILGTVPLNGSGQAVFTTFALKAKGIHTITAVYNGNYAVYRPSTSTPLQQTVVRCAKPAPTHPTHPHSPHRSLGTPGSTTTPPVKPCTTNWAWQQ